ncbi:MAG TPA: hypothetical protein ENL35_11745 [Chloroflexi bacterium]|nr:hypothetical protein [Chloroflexota bacterium]
MKNSKADNRSHLLRKGDWVVHHQYGPGRVVGREKKLIEGVPLHCYRIETSNSILWLPEDSEFKSRIRPIASPTTMRKAIRILKGPADPMQSAFHKRRQRIRDDSLDGSLISTATLIRDLCGRKGRRSLNENEMRSLQRLSDRFILEWSLSLGLPLEEARQAFNALILEVQAKEP